jgi:hypothetical protein
VIDAPARAGIAALLEDAEEREAALQLGAPGAPGAPGALGASGAPSGSPASPPRQGTDDPVPSTRTSAFAELMDDLTFNAPSPGALAPGALAAAPRSETAALLAVPAPLAGGGDLVFVIGLPSDALAVATAMAASVGSSALRRSGTVAGEAGRVEDRRSAITARANGVESGESTFVACGWGTGAVGILVSAQPDQVWVAVDAGRKPDDTARWVSAVAAAARIDAVATVGSASTSTPETVEELGLPIGWVDDRPATSRAA